nr:L-type lectin-domain containing receptor kinase VIII.1-like [Ipomoea trifida]
MTSLPGGFPGEIAANLLLVFLLFCFSGGTEFDFGTLNLSSLKLLGDAHLSNNTVRLTRDLGVPYSGAGKVLYAEPVRFRQPKGNVPPVPASFSTFFSFSVTNLNPSSAGGGLAFVITPEDKSVGDSGGYMGIMDAKGTQNGVVAVEFDTLMNVEFKDINGNHVGVDLGSLVSDQAVDLGSAGVDLKSGDLVNSWIDYAGPSQQLSVYVSYSNLKPKAPLLTVPLNLNEHVSEFMFVGFSGSTQGSTEVHAVEWWSFTSSSFDDGNTAKSPPPTTAPPPPPEKKTGKCRSLCKEGPGAVVGVVTAGAFFLCLAGVLFVWLYCKKVKRVKKTETLGAEIIKMPKEFSYRELKSATKAFDSGRIIGHGAVGTVYKGVLNGTGDAVAVKKCSHGGEGKAEFLSELSIIGTLRHRNLVRLQGWCHEKGEILLVYDLMPNGSLYNALFESRMVLSWPQRLKILLGVASAMSYLHQECENQVIHRDIKTGNIMLDEGFNARLGDFGLARQIEHDKSPDTTVAAGTMGYLAPEYVITGQATEKSDVYSFGAVSLEVASGRKPIGGNGNLVEWVWGLHSEGRLLGAADSRLNGEYDEGEMTRVLMVGLACSHPDPMARPTMRGVVQMLVGETEVLLLPRAKLAMALENDSMSDLRGAMDLV